MVIVSDLGYTPICNGCGIALCWDISEDDYLESPNFWDNWHCHDCDAGVVWKYIQTQWRLKNEIQ